MNTFEKILNVLAKNLGYTVVLLVAIVLFAYFSDGLIEGAITAVSALVGYACALQLVREYKKSAKSAHITPKDAVKKPATKKPAAKKTTKK